jgi:hypothetical protein
VLRYLAVVVLCSMAACRNEGPPLGDYPLATLNGGSVPSIYHATGECDFLVQSGLLRITEARLTLGLTIRQDCTRGGGSNLYVVWPYSSSGVAQGGTVIVTLRERDGDTIRLVGTYGGGFIVLASQAELAQFLSGTFRFGPLAPLP